MRDFVMNIEFDSYKVKLNDCKPALEGLAESLNLTGMKNELERLQAMQEAPGFWDDPEKSQKFVVKAKQIESKIGKYEAMCSSWDDLFTICDIYFCCRHFIDNGDSGNIYVNFSFLCGVHLELRINRILGKLLIQFCSLWQTKHYPTSLSMLSNNQETNQFKVIQSVNFICEETDLTAA